MGTDASTAPDGVTVDGERGDAPRRAIVVYHRDGLEVVPLADGRPIVIGRTEPADIRPRSQRLSRQHARFELVGDEAWVEDLGSTNGTFLNGRRLEQRARLHTGDEVTLGSVTVSVHGLDGPWIEPLGLDGHERFQATVEAELERARTFGRPVAIAMIRVSDPSASAPKLVGWVPRLGEQLRTVDRVGLYSADCVEVLLPECDADRAEATARDLVGRLADHAPLCCGVAAWPDAGATAAELVEAARAAVLRATAERPVVVHGAAPSEDPAEGPVVTDPAMVALYRTVDKVAASAISVLVVGETGTGKELVARALHERSERRRKPLRVVNCGAMPEALVESILFGHERGAFTGADQRRTGVFEEADGGSVFLDEIGELSLQAQVALLRVLETRQIQRVGASKEIPVDVRVIAATHRDLEAMCTEGKFRWDLLYRLNPITLHVPPLRDRPGEIRPLVQSFVRESNRVNRRAVRGVSPDALAHLERWPWPGNVRELRNTIERAVVVASGDTITVEDLPERVVEGPGLAPAVTEVSTPQVALRSDDDLLDEPTQPITLDLKERLRRHEIDLIRAALHAAHENQTQAAVLLRMPRRTLVYKMRAYGVRQGDARAALPEELDRRGRAVSFAERVDRFERGLVEEALARCGGDAGAAARLLNVQRRTLQQKLDRWGL